MQDRIRFIYDLDGEGYRWNYSTAVGAFVSCLEPDESCDALLMDLEQAYEHRRILVRKITSDIESDFLECHEQLVNELISQVMSSEPKKARNASQALGHICPALPLENQSRLIDALLQSRYREARARGYRLLSRQWNGYFEDAVAALWEKKHEFEVALLIVDNFPIEYVYENRSDLAAALNGTSRLAKLYIRLLPVYPELFDEIVAINGVMAVYAASKVGYPLQTSGALDLFERCRLEEKLDLFVWSLGKLRLWDALVVIVPQLDDAKWDRHRADMERRKRQSAP